jgi:hypothetical protein
MSMKVPTKIGKTYPLSLLIEGNIDAHSQLYEVLSSFKDKDLTYKFKDNRTISEMISHTLCTQYCFYTHTLVLGKECKCPHSNPRTVNKATGMIEKNLDDVTKIWSQLKEKSFKEEFKSEWGQILTKELALFQSIEHFMYHVGEICLTAGIGGFYRGTLG